MSKYRGLGVFSSYRAEAEPGNGKKTCGVGFPKVSQNYFDAQNRGTKAARY